MKQENLCSLPQNKLTERRLLRKGIKGLNLEFVKRLNLAHFM